MSEPRPPIPPDVRRAVQQRCGFGCVLCGCPVYQIHHMDEWAVVQEHRAERLTLLCGTHHADATGERLDKDTVEVANAEPFNVSRGRSTPHRWFFRGTHCDIFLGNVRLNNILLQDQYSAVVIDGNCLLGFRFHDGHMLLQLLLVDATDTPLLVIRDGLMEFSTGIWHVDLVGPTLTIRDGPRRIRLEIELRPPSSIAVLKGWLMLHGVAIAISEQGITLANTGSTWSNCVLGGGQFGLALGRGHAGPGAISIAAVPRYLWLTKTATRTVSDSLQHFKAIIDEMSGSP